MEISLVEDKEYGKGYGIDFNEPNVNSFPALYYMSEIIEHATPYLNLNREIPKELKSELERVSLILHDQHAKPYLKEFWGEDYYNHRLTLCDLCLENYSDFIEDKKYSIDFIDKIPEYIKQIKQASLIGKDIFEGSELVRKIEDTLHTEQELLEERFTSEGYEKLVEQWYELYSDSPYSFKEKDKNGRD